jgi:hypothetical protein
VSLLVLALLLLAGIALFFVLLGSLTKGSGADLLDWDPAGRAERRAGLDREDYEELLEVNNRYRRERGLPELVEEDREH